MKQLTFGSCVEQRGLLPEPNGRDPRACAPGPALASHLGMNRRFALGSLVVLTMSCGASESADGAVGTKARVRFSQVFAFSETQGFDAAIADGATMLVELQDATAGGSEPPSAPRYTLTAKPIGHQGTATVLPLGFARSAVQLQGAGAWRLEALEGGRVVDEVAVRVAPATQLGVGADATVETRGLECSQVRARPLRDVVLGPNQRLSLYFVPLDAQGHPLTGLLALTAEARSTLRLTTPALLPATQPNQLVVEPVALDGLTETLRVSAAGTGHVDVPVPTSTVSTEPACN